MTNKTKILLNQEHGNHPKLDDHDESAPTPSMGIILPIKRERAKM